MKNIVYTRHGAWKFYHDKKLGICFYAPNALTPMILFENGMQDFDVVADENDVIYLICQDDKNNIYMLWFDKKGWNRQCILESKSAFPYEKNFSLISVNGWLNAFYTIRHDKKFLLIHHILNNDQEPKVIETSENPLVYTITKDTTDNIYCIYDKDNIGYQVFNWNLKEWQHFSVLCKSMGELKFISAVTDKNDALRITCCCREKNDYSIYYIDRSGVQKIINRLSSNPMPVIFVSDAYYILFKLGGRILKCSSDNPETGFLKPSYYFPGSFIPHSLFKLSSSVPLVNSRVFANIIYGSEPRSDRFEPAFISEAIKELDFSIPETPIEKTPDVELFKEQSDTFEQKETEA